MKKLGGIFLFIWVLGISFVATSLHSWHMADLSPREENLKQLKVFASDFKEHNVLHFLTPKCSCSHNIFDHLLNRGPLETLETSEKVVVIDDDKNEFVSKLKNHGYKVVDLKTKNLSKELSGAIKGVPLLVIYDKNRFARYAGGYADKVITPFTKINIKKFLNEIRSGRSIASMAVKGCAVSKEYQKILDPLGIKYQKTGESK